MDVPELVAAARAARAHAYCPYSGFAVGAAVKASSGEIYAGCNVENRTYGATVCAERAAVVSAVAAGARAITAIAVVADAEPPATPCGVCRQVLAEFASLDLPVLVANLAGEQVLYRLGELLPHPFDLPAGRGSRPDSSG